MPGAVPDATIPELDTTTRLQLAVSDLCGLYSNALGRLLNAVEERAGPSEPAIELLAADLGLQVAKAHRGIDDLTDELRRKLRSEATQLQRLRVLELEHSAVTRELRIEVEAAGVLRRVHANLACAPVSCSSDRLRCVLLDRTRSSGAAQRSGRVARWSPRAQPAAFPVDLNIRMTHITVIMPGLRARTHVTTHRPAGGVPTVFATEKLVL